MKRTLILSLALAASPLPLLAQEPAAPAAAEAKSGADAAWAELEPLLQQPSEKPKDPKDREEVMAIYKRHLEAYDAKAAEFLKNFPDDARRWKLVLQDFRTNSIRQATNVAPKSKEDLAKGLEAILAAKDADEESKAMASFLNAISSRDDSSTFQKLAEAHLKAYPDFPGNQTLTREVKNMEEKEKLKEELAKGPLDLKFTATDGTEVDLAKMRGKVVLIDFWATWCGPCVGEIPNVVASHNKLHPKGFEILGISFDKEQDKLDTMTKEKNMPWLQYFDGKGWQNEIGQRFGINSIPAMWLVNKKGMVVDLNARGGLEEKVAKLLEEAE